MTLAVYQATRVFPEEEVYGLTSPMRRASPSIPDNIAEGCCRSGDAEFRRFLYYAAGSTSGLEYHAVLAKDLGCLDEQQYRVPNDQLSEVKRMLITSIEKLKA
ncbi:MAG: four helix bundle protein [Candidatus Edwardsbacteria bacterium]|nr:four helix bundle protein [Candidatus Edwardsbacteria bacterium]